jgi:transposase-like protein
VSEPTPRHAPPFFCPYCGEEDIRPFGEAAAQYRCGSCLRVWTLRMVGTTRAGAPDEPDQTSREEALP